MSSAGPDPQRFVIVPKRNHLRGWLVFVAALWVASLLATWYLSTRLAAPPPNAISGERIDSSRGPGQQQDLLRELRQQVATLRRSDQISRNANVELQSTLAEREEEVSGLRADIDFYERLVGSTGQRQALRVHEAKFTPESGGTWHYTVTLTQNLNRGAISKGSMRFAVEGVRGGKLSTIKWDELLQEKNAAAKPFSFRYFQQLDGSVILPPGFTPQRVRVSLNASGNAVEQTFAWEGKKTQGE